MNRDAQGHRVVRVRTLLAGAAVLLGMALVVGIWKREFVRAQVQAQMLGNLELVTEKYGLYLRGRVDAVELFEIAEKGKGTNSISISIGLTKEKLDYSAKRNLTGAASETFMNHWSHMHFHWYLSGMCHEPAFAIRFLKNGKPELETTLCLKCQNFLLPDFPFYAEMGFDTTNPTGQAFVAHMKSLFPDSPKWKKAEVKSEPSSKPKE